MAKSDSSATPPLPATAPLAPKKENTTSVASKLAELNESRTELLGRIQGLKQDLQNWRSRLDTQAKIYHDELSELKKSLNVEVEQLRLEFQELRSSLQQQKEDVNASLKNLGVLDCQQEAKGGQVSKFGVKAQEVDDSHLEEMQKKVET